MNSPVCLDKGLMVSGGTYGVKFYLSDIIQPGYIVIMVGENYIKIEGLLNFPFVSGPIVIICLKLLIP